MGNWRSHAVQKITTMKTLKTVQRLKQTDTMNTEHKLGILKSVKWDNLSSIANQDGVTIAHELLPADAESLVHHHNNYELMVEAIKQMVAQCRWCSGSGVDYFLDGSTTECYKCAPARAALAKLNNPQP